MHPTHATTDRAATPADILRGAARYLEIYGWHTGALYPDPKPTTTTKTRPGNLFPPACALAAIRTATCGRVVRLHESLTTDEKLTTAAAEKAFLGYLDTSFAGDDDHVPDAIADWNDENDRTLTDVVTALRDAATDWDRIHSPANPADTDDADDFDLDAPLLDSGGYLKCGCHGTQRDHTCVPF
jgi:hypothetical protein